MRFLLRRNDKIVEFDCGNALCDLLRLFAKARVSYRRNDKPYNKKRPSFLRAFPITKDEKI
jgi:hypothetical protein